ncbi:zinc-binding protein A33-like isoform X1 [Arapaima gigas]
MASKQTNSEDNACFVCFDVFQPVPLSCGHNFCKSCLQQSWVKEGHWGCPLCQNASPREELPKSRVLDHLCKQMQKLDASEKPEAFCSQHEGEQLQFFCHTDSKLMCAMCQASREHETHNYYSIVKAAQMYKGMVKVLTEPLQKHLQVLEKAHQAYDDAAKKIKIVALKTEREMKEQFVALHSFLYEEELLRMEALQREEAQKSQQMRENKGKMSEEISSLSERIEILEHELGKDDIMFLRHLDSTMERTYHKLHEPEMPPESLMDMDSHLENLQYGVWVKMKGIVQDGLSYHEDLQDYQAASAATAIPEDFKCPENLNDCPEVSTPRVEEQSLHPGLPTAAALPNNISSDSPQPDPQQYQLACTFNSLTHPLPCPPDPNPSPVVFLPEPIPSPIFFFPNHAPHHLIFMPNNAPSAPLVYAPDPTLPQPPNHPH